MGKYEKIPGERPLRNDKVPLTWRQIKDIKYLLLSAPPEQKCSPEKLAKTYGVGVHKIYAARDGQYDAYYNHKIEPYKSNRQKRIEAKRAEREKKEALQNAKES